MIRLSRMAYFLAISLAAFSALPVFADQITSVCFTPGEDCRSLIVDTINSAKSSIRMHAYSFTSTPIAKALHDAHRRGVAVEAVLDKGQRTAKYSGATYLHNAGIPVHIDSRHAIQHNKVLVIDAQTVVTGSYNFTKAAQERNAENVVVINDPDIAAKYLANWQKCKEHSETYAR